jgi:hypothetical protein
LPASANELRALVEERGGFPMPELANVFDPLPVLPASTPTTPSEKAPMDPSELPGGRSAVPDRRGLPGMAAGQTSRPKEGDSPMMNGKVTPEQWQEQVTAIKRFADVLAERDGPAGALWSVVKRLKDSVDELMSWIDPPAWANKEEKA